MNVSYSILMIWAMAASASAIGTFYLQQLGLPVVLSACICGIAGVALEYIFKIPSLSLLVFMGAFAGMSSAQVMNYSLLAICGIFIASFFYLSADVLKGFGGKLGAIALVSVALLVYVKQLLIK